MKTSCIIFINTITFILFIQVANAQRFLRIGKENPGSTQSFKAKSISKDSMIVYDVTNELSNSNIKYPVYSTLIFKRIPDFGNVFSSSFTDQRFYALRPERSITVNCYVNAEGEILETAFLLRKDTRVTSFEVELLQLRLINTKFGGLIIEKVKPANVFLIQKVIRYRRLLDSTVDSFL